MGNAIIVRSGTRDALRRAGLRRASDVAFAVLLATAGVLLATGCGPTHKQRQQMMIANEERAQAAAAAKASAASGGATQGAPGSDAAHAAASGTTVPGLVPPPEVDAERYRLAPGDIISVEFTFHPEENVRAPIRNDGRFTLPITGEFMAAGYTPEDLRHLITDKASVKLKKPVVNVVIVELAEHRVFVTGQVARPGFALYKPGMTAMQAIVERGGFVDDAKTDEIVHIHRVNGQVMNSKLDLQTVYESHGNDTTELSPNDILVVPRTWVGDADVFVDQWVRGLLPTIPVPTYDITTYFLF